MKIAYECDKRACDQCSKYCDHTEKIEHAKNFESLGNDYYFERSRKGERIDALVQGFLCGGLFGITIAYIILYLI